MEIAPPAQKIIALCLPTGWALAALNQVISFGSDFSAVLKPIAMLLARKIRGISVWRTIYFLPSVVSVVAISVLWYYVFNPQYGIVNSLLGDYTTGMLQYTLVAGLIVLWGRATRHRPSAAAVIAATWMIAVTSIVVGVFRGCSVDTAQLIFGLIGGIVAVRFDRAIFGDRHPGITAPAAEMPEAARP